MSQDTIDRFADPGLNDDLDRRTFLASASSLIMAGGLASGYGTFAFYAARYLYPAKPQPKTWLFVKDVARFKKGEALAYQLPSGASVAVARQGDSGEVSDFIALSNVCPHLGCKVHWEGQNNRFLCPCHNGVFDPVGKAVSGPPADAHQSLPRFPLKIENGLLFIEVPERERADSGSSGSGVSTV